MSQPECLHDDRYDEREEWLADRKRHTRHCASCGSLLFTAEFFLDGRRERTIHDEVYKMLYTREGRWPLVLEALKARGFERLPSFWHKSQQAWEELRRRPGGKSDV